MNSSKVFFEHRLPSHHLFPMQRSNQWLEDALFIFNPLFCEGNCGSTNILSGPLGFRTFKTERPP